MQYIYGKVGCLFVKMIRAFPPLWALICLLGIGLGILGLTGHGKSDDLLARLMPIARVVGVLCIVGYGSLLCVFLIKCIRGTWMATCDRMIELFERMMYS